MATYCLNRGEAGGTKTPAGLVPLPNPGRRRGGIARGRWVGGWVGRGERGASNALLYVRIAWVGGWVGGWVDEEKTVRMRCCMLGFWVGGWVTEYSLSVPPIPIHPPTHPPSPSPTQLVTAVEEEFLRQSAPSRLDYLKSSMQVKVHPPTHPPTYHLPNLSTYSPTHPPTHSVRQEAHREAATAPGRGRHTLLLCPSSSSSSSHRQGGRGRD